MSLKLNHRICVEALWLWYIIAPTKLTPLARINTGNQRLWLATTNSAVTGPANIPGIVARVFDIANVIPAWFGAISAWFDKCPAELHALNPILIDIKLEENIFKINKNLWREINITQQQEVDYQLR